MRSAAHFSADRVVHTGPAPASEDFGCFGTEWHAPSVFWFVGGTDPDTYAKAKEAGRLNDIPVNHSPRFAPVIHPTLSWTLAILGLGGGGHRAGGGISSKPIRSIRPLATAVR